MSDAAIRAARAVGYVGAGTVEFIAEGGDFYFMEMNTRLQVEHPVTEAILGLDLVEWQLKIAAGEPIAFDQDDVAIDGHAVEARLYAENTRGGRFLPSTGILHRVAFGEARVDTAARDRTEVTVHYDPMLAKVIAHGATRAQAVARLDAALRGPRSPASNTTSPGSGTCLATRNSQAVPIRPSWRSSTETNWRRRTTGA